MKKKFIVLITLMIVSYASHAQSKNIIIITTDGFRWQEVFSGMDKTIGENKKYYEGDSAQIFKKYWNEEGWVRRKLLMPFLWGTIAKQGQIYGNRKADCNVDVANGYWFSYPGYNEIMTGYPDTAVNSNSYPPNPNTNILEFLNKQSAFKNKVAAFGAWDAFRRILNEKRCGFPVVDGFETVSVGNISAKQKLINEMLVNSYKPFGEEECLDVFTHYAAMEYLKNNKPRVLYIGYGETDEWAHGGKYKSYLNAANQVDKWIEEIWSYVQSDPFYKNNTILFITVDHGRGASDEWTDHGSDVKGASQTWFAVIGPGLKPKGEVKAKTQFYNKQFAQTIASILGYTYIAEHSIGEKMKL
jgi:hypothetical protein